MCVVFILCCYCCIALGFSAAIVAGNVTTTSLVVGNAVGMPNATTLGNDIQCCLSLRLLLLLQGEYPLIL